MTDALFLGEFAKTEKEFQVKHYEVPRYADGGPFLYTPPDWPVLYRASGGWASYGPRIEISIHQHPVISYTAQGCWIHTWQGKKFVNLRAEKQWASDSEAEAIRQLYFRKRKQIQYLQRNLSEAEEALGVLEKHFDQKPPPARPYRGGYDEDYY